MSDITKGTSGQSDFPVTFNSATGTIQDEAALAAIAAAGGGGSTPLVNNLTSTSTTSALTANMGKVLKDTADALATTVSQKVIVAGDLGGTAAVPVVAKVNGVTVTGVPSTGQILEASGSSAASWVTKGGPGSVLGSTYTAIGADDGKIHGTPVNCVVTVNTGLVSGYGLGFTGAGVVTFAGSATIVDKRTTGATNPVCSLVMVPGGTFEIWGTKA